MRHEKFNKKYGMAYGRDHICKLFIQVWKLNPKFGERALENRPEDDNMIIDKDNLAIQELVSIAGEYGFNLEDELTEQIIIYD